MEQELKIEWKKLLVSLLEWKKLAKNPEYANMAASKVFYIKTRMEKIERQLT